MLTLEVTETEVMADLAQASKVLDQLSGLGIKIGIDDYGTGYSSLAYLHRLPVHELKIDRSFVTNLPNEASNRIIVKSSITMAHSLGLHVVAEGAEDELTCAMLADAELRLHSGLLPVPPQKADDLQEWLLGGAQARVRPDRGDPGLRGCGHDAPVQVRLTHPGRRQRRRGTGGAHVGAAGFTAGNEAVRRWMRAPSTRARTDLRCAGQREPSSDRADRADRRRWRDPVRTE